MKIIAGKLERVRSERDKAEAAVTELRAKLDALDVEADDYATVRQSIDAQLAVRVRALGILNEQVAKLEAKAADEERAASATRRATAIKQVEAMLPDRAKIVEQIEAAVLRIPGLFEKLAAWQSDFVRKYPKADLPLPYAHYLDADRIRRTVLASFRTIRPEDICETITGLAREEVKLHVEMVGSLQATKEEAA
jgi:hypothetical protein